MKRFLKKVLLFLFILLCLLAVTLQTLSYMNARALHNYKVDPKITTIFMGDSHVQCAINDQLLPKSRSFAQSAEALYFTYYKLEGLLQNNPSIKKVYLGFGCHNISSHFDEYIFGEFSKDIATRYFFVLPTDMKLQIIDKNKGDMVTFLGNVIANGWKNKTLDKDNSLLGHYENFFTDCAAAKSSMDIRLGRQYRKNGKLRTFSDINIAYVGKIAKLCQSKNVELIILNTPLHPYYKSKIPVEFTNEYNKVLASNKLKVYDFSTLTLNDSAYVPDGDHISAKGSFQTTALFKE